MLSRYARAFVIATLPLALACTDETSVPGGGNGSGGEGSTPVTPDQELVFLAGQHCDPMVPEVCAFPFPSNVYLVQDPTTLTKRRVHFAETSLPMFGDDRIPGNLWHGHDGFSTGMAAMTYMAGATTDGLANQDSIASSIKIDSPTILLNADTLEPVPHFIDLDMNADDASDRALMLRPVQRLGDATRYIVAMRNIVDGSGDTIVPSDVFRALRDGLPSDDPTVDARRPLYKDIFEKLQAAGYDVSDLQIAWDYSTSSRANNTRWMLHMRDEALGSVGNDGPEYEIDEVIDNPNDDIRRRIKGRFKVPLYLEGDDPDAGGLNFGDDGLPEPNGTAFYEFQVQVPHAAINGTPGAILQNGHGLLGKLTEGENGYLAKIANMTNKVTISVQMIGFQDPDEDPLAIALAAGDIGFLEDMFERQHQGMINALLAMRMMKGRFVNEPNVQFDGKSAIDPARAYYRGDSQGGIFGTTYMAISTDVTRGLVGEPGMPYNLLLDRSVDYRPFFVILEIAVPKAIERQLILGLAQMWWDKTDPNGYAPYISENLLPSTPAHQILIHVAMGDHQVSPLGAHVIARTVGAKNIKPINRNIFGVPTVDAPHEGNGIVEFNFYLPELPKTNTPTTEPEDDDPHDLVRELDASILQADKFFNEGIIDHFCTGICDPE